METVSDKTFKQKVIKASGPVVVDFFTSSCGPCRMLAPILDKISKEQTDVTFYKFDAGFGHTPDDYDISAVPALLFFKGGEEVDRLEGLFPKPMIVNWVEQNKAD